MDDKTGFEDLSDAAIEAMIAKLAGELAVLMQKPLLPYEELDVVSRYVDASRELRAARTELARRQLYGDEDHG